MPNPNEVHLYTTGYLAAIAAVSFAFFVICIVVVDLLLLHAKAPTISMTVLYWSKQNLIIPWLVGLMMGVVATMIACHLWFGD